jgi:hypothetical protein
MGSAPRGSPDWGRESPSPDPFPSCRIFSVFLYSSNLKPGVHRIEGGPDTAPDRDDDVELIFARLARAGDPSTAQAAWQLAGRLGGARWGDRILKEVLAGNGMAMEGLASLGDVSFLSELQSLVERPSKNVFDAHVARRAMRGLLSIGSGEGLGLVATYTRDPNLRSVALRAIGEHSSPTLVGEGLLLGATSQDPDLVAAVEENVHTSLQEIAGLSAQSPARTKLRESLRRAISQLPPQSTQYSEALEYLVIHGTAEDLDLVRTAALSLEPTVRDAILSRVAALEGQ